MSKVTRSTKIIHPNQLGNVVRAKNSNPVNRAPKGPALQRGVKAFNPARGPFKALKGNGRGLNPANKPT